jgi:hypothetical protein
MYLVNTSGIPGIALNGYDPVSFFSADGGSTNPNPLNGNHQITSEHKGGTCALPPPETQPGGLSRLLAPIDGWHGYLPPPHLATIARFRFPCH